MALTTVDSLVALLKDAHLLPASQLKSVCEELVPGASSAQQLADLLQQRDWLTPFQVERIFKGAGDSLVLGAYVLIESLGEGGMGQVFKARHQTMDRIVALKVIRQTSFAEDPELVRRFQREARAAAVLAHPNVVLVYDSQARDTYFIAMQYLEGTDLAQLVKEEGPLAPAQACDFIRQAALGLQHIHEHGMVHRDIKPSNLMAVRPAAVRPPAAAPEDAGSRTVVDRPSARASKTSTVARQAPAPPGSPTIKVLDMGLVRMNWAWDTRSTGTSLTQDGSMVGTPDYIAPEQARDARRVDIRADLYSLGCSFYYLMTGKPPFTHGTAIEKVLMHQLDEPKPVEELRPGVPPEVAAVVRKLMAKRPMDRYQTPTEVAEALTALASKLATRPSAAPPTVHPVTIPAPAQREGDTPPVTPRMMVVPTTEIPDKVAASVFHWDSSAPKTPAEGEPGVEKAKKIAFLKGHSGCVMSVAFAPNRDVLASGALDCRTRIWDFAGKNPRERSALKTHNTPAHALAFSPDSTRLATGSGAPDGLIWLWDMREEHPPGIAVLQGHQGPVESLDYSTDGKHLASASSDKTVRIWEVTGPDYRCALVLKGHTRCVKAVVFAPDGKSVASAGEDGTVRLWNPARSLWSKEIAVLEGHEGYVYALAFSADGLTLASAGQDQTVILWDLTATPPRQRAVLEGHSSAVRALRFTPDGQMLVSADDGRQAIQWSPQIAERQRTWALPDPLIVSFAFTIDARYLAAGTSEGPVAVYRLGEKRKSSTATPAAASVS